MTRPPPPSSASAVSASKPVVFVVIGHYLPGWKAGGQVATTSAAIDSLRAHVGFRVVCLDRDLRDANAYPGVTTGAWRDIGGALVCHLPASRLVKWWRDPAMTGIGYDLLWLHGLFSTSTITTLARRRLPGFRPTPAIVVPHGELSEGALSIKPLKKTVFLAAAKSAGLYRGLWWQVSGPSEAADVGRVFPRLPAERIRIVRNPSGQAFVPSQPADKPGAGRSKTRGRLRVAFLSRISPKKNLDVALRVLQAADGHVDFDIFGPIDDDRHWARCQDLAQALPRSVRVTYRGPVEPALVPSTLRDYHALLLPTRGENFGHVILEALQAGCLPLISDTTPWRGLERARAGWDIPLSDMPRFKAALRRLTAMDEAEFLEWSASAMRLGQAAAADPQPIAQLRALFCDALEQVDLAGSAR